MKSKNKAVEVKVLRISFLTKEEFKSFLPPKWCHNPGLNNPVTRACVQSRFSHVWLFATLRTVAHQAPLSKGFSKQEY